MSILNPETGYFPIDNPFRVLDRWRNGYRYRKIVEINRRQMEMRWSRRAQHELLRRQHPLIVELQLYFSCVVKKRVLFHEHTEFNSVRVNDRLAVAFRPVAWPGREHGPGNRGDRLPCRLLARLVSLWRRSRLALA